MPPIVRFGLLPAVLLSLSTALQAGVPPLDPAVGGAVGAAHLAERYGVRSERADAVRIVDDPLQIAGKVFELTLPPSGKRAAPQRSEAYVLNEATRSGLRWYAFSILLPSGWSAPGTPVTVARIDASAPAAALPPPLSLVVQGRELRLELHASELSGAALTADRVDSQRIPLEQELSPKQWYCVIVRADWQAELGQGALDVWLGSTKVYRAAGRNNTYPGATLAPAVGLSMADAKTTAARTLYADFIWLGGHEGAKTTHKQMHDQTPCARKR